MPSSGSVRLLVSRQCSVPVTTIGFAQFLLVLIYLMHVTHTMTTHSNFNHPPNCTCTSVPVHHESTKSISTSQPDEQIVLVQSNSVPFYRLVDYFTQETMQREAQVHDLNITYFLYYTHMYFAWMQVETSLSMVAISDRPETPIIHGANMVLPIRALASMYAPGNISLVLDFVRRCYDHVRVDHGLEESANSYVTTLRTAESLSIHERLVAEVTRRFNETAELGAYHLLWADHTLMDSFLKKLGYSRMPYSGPQARSDVCNWARLGIQSNKAQNLCIYLLNKS